ncbi:MAG: carbohydrate ABC transporter permease [Anaerolineae bacterium]|nr:carbohydrate ABC transporter permease [Anaerolineae bacterium]
MTPQQRTLWNTYLPRAIAYLLLTFFAFLMIFPFIYMMMTSFKNSSDVFHFPPRLFPYSAETREQNGETLPIYRFTVDGVERDFVLVEGERTTFGFFTAEDQVNVDSPRDSNILSQVPLDEAVATGETVALQGADGEQSEFDVYEVPAEGGTQRLLLAYRGAMDKFVDPEDPEIFTYAVARTAPLSEYIDFQFSNYNRAFDELNLNRALVNTTIVTLGVVAGQLVTSIFGGYAFSRVQFRGRNTLFLVYLGSIMIPFVVLIIPMYRVMVIIGWENRLVSLIVPWIFTAYGTFLLRQFFITIPKEIEEAALMDGASRLRILWTIFVPLSQPAIATLAIFSFLYAWNSFLWPLLIIGEGNTANHVLTLSMIRLRNVFADQPNLVLTGAAVAILPPIIIFILAQRYFIEGVASSGVKG